MGREIDDFGHGLIVEESTWVRSGSSFTVGTWPRIFVRGAAGRRAMDGDFPAAS